ncbi:MAG: hypothetical protein K8R40_11585 [Anaerolineaceae bacterium]|nr:hypothetical protein [Anaerolineaceae bacterium]
MVSFHADNQRIPIKAIAFLNHFRNQFDCIDRDKVVNLILIAGHIDIK